MAVPTRAEALSLLMSTAPSPRLLQHCTVVAEVASFLAMRAARAGLSVDRRLVEAAALLHDVDKALPVDHPVRALGHGPAGAAWLSEAGHPELVRAVTAHPVGRLQAADAASWVLEGPLEERIVSYADKRATQRVVSLEQRFERWRRRHPEYVEQLERAMTLASQLESALCEAVGVRADAIERLRWVDAALQRAEGNGRLVVPGAAASTSAPAASPGAARTSPAGGTRFGLRPRS